MPSTFCIYLRVVEGKKVAGGREKEKKKLFSLALPRKPQPSKFPPQYSYPHNMFSFIHIHTCMCIVLEVSEDGEFQMGNKICIIEE